jgi:hypothetical protein
LRAKDTTKFSIDNLHHYHLLLQFGEKRFELSVVDSRNSTCLHVEDFSIKNEEEYLDAIKKVYDGHHILMAGFWKSVKVSFKTDKFSLVPADYFDKDQLSQYLQLNSTYGNSKESAYYYKFIKSDAVNVFAANNELITWLESIYQKSQVQVFHQASGFIEGVLHNNDHNLGKNMFLSFDGKVLQLLITEDKKLIFYNQFRPADLKQLLRDVLLIMKAMKMDPRVHKVVIWGNVNAESSIFKGLYKYIKNVSLGTRPSFLKFNYQFDEIPDSRFFDLYSLNLCD